MRSFRYCIGDVSPEAAARFRGSSLAMASPSKKSLRAAERKRADVARARRRWIREQGWLDTTRLVFIAGLRQTGIVAPMLIKGAMKGEAFLAYVEQCLAPTLKRGDIAVVDNVPF